MMGVDSDFAKILAQGQDLPEMTRDRQVAVLLTHARHTSKHLTAMAEAIDEIRLCTNELTRMAHVQQAELAANTEITSGVRDTIRAGRLATRVVKWLSGIALALVSFYTAWSIFTNNGHGGGPGAGGIGP